MLYLLAPRPPGDIRYCWRPCRGIPYPGSRYIVYSDAGGILVGSRERLAEVLDELQRFRFCGPGDDPDEQTAVTTGYRHLLLRFKRMAIPVILLRYRLGG